MILTKKSIESLLTTCKEKIPAITDYLEPGITAEPSVTGTNISSVVICVFVQAAKYNTSIGRTMDATNMH